MPEELTEGDREKQVNLLPQGLTVISLSLLAVFPGSFATGRCYSQDDDGGFFALSDVAPVPPGENAPVIAAIG